MAGIAPSPALAYHQYLGPALFLPHARLTLAAADPKQGERALDVACGSGIVTAFLPGLVGAKGKVTGLDINANMLEVAAAQEQLPGPKIEWIHGSAMQLPFPDASYDVLTCQQGLQFFPDREAGAREMRRVLAPGGRAVVACWQSLERQTFFATLMRSIARHLNVTESLAAAPFTLGDADMLRSMLETAGFSRVEVQPHVIDARFPQPETFVRLTTGAGAAVMPDVYDGVDVESLVGKVVIDCKPDFKRYSEGDLLRFPMPTHIAVAHV